MARTFAVLVLACWACAYQGRRLQASSNDDVQDARLETDDVLKALAVLLHEPSPALKLPAGQSAARRGALQKAAAATAAAAAVSAGVAPPAVAGPFDFITGGGGGDAQPVASDDGKQASTLAGQLEAFEAKEFKVFKPTYFNQRLNEVPEGRRAFEVKWIDIIQTETVGTVSIAATENITSMKDVGTLEKVARVAAKNRNATVVESAARETSAGLVYSVELKGEEFNEIDVFSVARNKFFRMELVSKKDDWKKWRTIYQNMALSFVPRGCGREKC